VVEKRTNENGLEIWRKALTNVSPSVEVKSRRVGGATFQVPTEVRPERKQSLGMKWLINFARKRGEKTMVDRLAAEIIAASKGEGAAVKRKMIPIEWQKQTKRSRTSVCKKRHLKNIKSPRTSGGFLYLSLPPGIGSY